MPSESHMDTIIEDLCSDLSGREKIIEMEKMRQHLIQNMEPLDVEDYDNFVKAKDYIEDNATKELFLNGNAYMVPFMNPNKRDIVYICGKSGSGKSTFTKNLIEEYRKIFPGNKVYILSTLKSDETLDDLKPPLIRLPITEEYIKSLIPSFFKPKKEPKPIILKKGEKPKKIIKEDEDQGDKVLNKFKDSLIIFDDTDTIVNKKLRDAVTALKNILLETGRHATTYMIITSHLMTKGHETRTILNEANSLVFFPHEGNIYQLNYTLKNYYGLGRQQINKVLEQPSRWIQLHASSPTTILHEAGAYII